MRSRTGYPELIVCGLIWGSIGVLVKQAEAGAVPIVFFRLLFGVLVVAGWQAMRGRASSLRLGPRRGLVLLAGVGLAAHWLTFFEALKRMDVAETVLILFIGPVFIALAAPLVLGERVHRRAAIALVLALGGIALIALPDAERLDTAGVALALVSAVLFAVVVLSAKVLTRHYEPPALVTWQYSIAAAVLAPLLLTADASAIAPSLPAMLTLGVVHTGLTGILYFRALTLVQAHHAGILIYLEPASAVLYAWAFLSDAPTALTLAGGALIALAGALIVLGRDPERVAPAEAPIVVAKEVAG